MADRADAGKKRKRPADGSSKPSKRVAIVDQKQVKISLQDAGEWAPVIASTPGLAVPTSLPLKTYVKGRANAPETPGRSGSVATKELLLHSSEHPKLDYTAREEARDGVESHLKHYVGVFDPVTGKLEVMEARKMEVRGSVRAHQATLEDIGPLNMREQRDTLGKVFGTKKSKKAIQSVTENAISPDKSLRNLGKNGTTKVDATAAAVLANMADATSGMATKEELQAKADSAKPRPKANLETQDITQVYTIDGLVGNDIIGLIPVLKWQKAIKEKQEVFSTSRFVGSRIAKFADSVEKLKVLRYMQLVINFYNACTPNKQGRKLPKREEFKSILEEVPESVLESIKRKFADGFMMNKFNTDNLITHLCALALVVDNYELDTWALKEDLRLEVTAIANYFREVGARIVVLPRSLRAAEGLDKAAAAQRRYVRLKIPLEFPMVGFGRRK